MDQVILEQKLESLRHCVQRVRDKTPPDVAQLSRDADLQDILVLNLTRAVHNYEVINWEIVFAICRTSLADFRRFAKEIADYGIQE